MKRTSIKYIDETSLCIQRKRHGRGFAFFDEQGRKITAEKDIRRLRKIIVPPMWTDVVICKFDDGHIQATGRDAKGRKQYIYHTEWQKQKQEEKFARMAAFGEKLPRLRKKAHQDLQQKEWAKTKVLALMVEILDDCGIRIGNQQYAQENETFGLTTLRRRHINMEGNQLIFSFKGKSNQQREVNIEDKFLIKHIKEVAQLPGYEIFKYKGMDGKMHSVDSHDVNEYITEITGEGFSSKDFRTWVGSRLAVELYPKALELKISSPRKKLGNLLIRLVADELGNTPTVCRSYYVHPLLLQKIDADEIPKSNPFKDSKTGHGLSATEKLTLKLLKK